MKTIISIADIHFGVIDPKFEYETLTRDFTNRISQINFNILAICGDLFDSKMMSNNPAVSYAMRFIDDLVHLCTMRAATLILLEGTSSHDSGQLSLFYHYLHNHVCDIRIVEQIKFEQVQGLNILCIPEKYGIPASEYNKYLYESGLYDICLLHGTYRGSFHGSEVATLESNHAPIFGEAHFSKCAGVILMGHYHIPGCYDEYAYYNGSPMRWCFGEEQQKGFLVTAYNELTRRHYTELIPVYSHSYITINIDDIINNDPKMIIDYIRNYKEQHGVDYIRIQYNTTNQNMTIVKNYYRTNSHFKFDELSRKESQIKQIDEEILAKNEQYPYVMDPSIDDYSKFVMYVNQNENCEYITSDELIKLLEEEL